MAAAIQWLDPSQTAGGKYPFMFTQSQAILARSWVPLQDGPGVKFTYSAAIACPVNLMALMSAENDTVKHTDGVYHFKQSNPIPSYLMALAVEISHSKAWEKIVESMQNHHCCHRLLGNLQIWKL